MSDMDDPTVKNQREKKSNNYLLTLSQALC